MALAAAPGARQGWGGNKTPCSPSISVSRVVTTRVDVPLLLPPRELFRDGAMASSSSMKTTCGSRPISGDMDAHACTLWLVPHLEGGRKEAKNSQTVLGPVPL
jgi:hypothetical protein